MDNIIRPVSALKHSAHREPEDPRHQRRVAFLGSLAAGIAHDNANTFNALLLKLELLRQKEIIHACDLQPIERQLRRAAQRAAQLNEFIKGDVDINRFTAVDLQKTIQDAIELVGRRESGNEGSTRRWTVEYEMPDLPPIAGPAGELTYLFVNLLMNACEAMPDGGLINVSGRVEDGEVVVAIADQGCGIPSEMLTKIFDDSVTTKSSGSGWGLFMARELMRQLGGSIAAENRPKGGALFTLRFPLATSIGRAD
jgi:signal transduction histidine kinase